ncbi:MAG: hydroxyacid dehydrogenase [Lacrimispora celerecrescens]|mgnify:CR=1 FL=1|uniref:NAD(P)-dependent oxidoreductase n=1 Tax=Lacrimispora indolis TaxID=69825 RepID=UPI000421DFBF|nr:NAD(P)-dependent oxidoreductase [[Clostridium] methoxybenzovorans]MBE7721916.1 hydroxyacid dehydrogenase [Lacrimispora celerecrescens]
MKITLAEPLSVPKALIGTYAEKLAAQGHDFSSYDTVAASEEELIERSKGSDIVIIANHPYSDTVVRAVQELKMIAVAFTGIDHVGVQACREQGVTVCNAAGYSNQTVAELVIGMAVAALRNLRKADQQLRAGGTSAGIGGKEICGRTVGIVGVGRIGLVTAKLFQAFGAKVIAYDPASPEMGEHSGIVYQSLEEVLSRSDLVSLHLPLNENTRGFINEERLALMKRDAVLINCARGPIVDNNALAEALNGDRLGYACIDVYDGEPPLAKDYPLLHAKNTLLTPHQAFLSEESMVRRAEITFGNVEKYLAGTPENVCVSLG